MFRKKTFKNEKKRCLHDTMNNNTLVKLENKKQLNSNSSPFK